MKEDEPNRFFLYKVIFSFTNFTWLWFNNRVKSCVKCTMWVYTHESIERESSFRYFILHVSWKLHRQFAITKRNTSKTKQKNQHSNSILTVFTFFSHQYAVTCVLRWWENCIITILSCFTLKKSSYFFITVNVSSFVNQSGSYS